MERPTFAWKEIITKACASLPGQCFVTELPDYVRGHLLPRLGGGSEGEPTLHIIALRAGTGCSNI
jgi:hypothetical protein